MASLKKLGLLIPQFPGQTHIAWWRVGRAINELGVEMRMLSTRRPVKGTDGVHGLLRDQAKSTHYLWPPRLSSLAFAIARPIRLWNAGRYIATLPESSAGEKIKKIPMLLGGIDLARYAKRVGLDVVFIHSCADAAHAGAVCRIFGGPPYALRLGGDLEIYGKDHAAKMRHAALVVPAAPAYIEKLEKQCHVPPDRIHWTWVGVNTQTFTPHHPPPLSPANLAPQGTHAPDVSHTLQASHASQTSHAPHAAHAAHAPHAARAAHAAHAARAPHAPQTSHATDAHQTSHAPHASGTLHACSPDLTPDEITVVTVARLNITKGHEHALAAIAKLKDQGVNVRYRIAGGGPYEPNIRAEIERLGLADRIEMLGPCDQSQVIELLRDADLGLLCSWGKGEAAPAFICEAMSCGLPVVATRIGATDTMIEPGVDGELVDQKDIDGIADAIAKLAGDPAALQTMADAARRKAVTRFDTRIVAKRLLDALGKTTGLQTPTPPAS